MSKKRTAIEKTLTNLNIPKKICIHLVGETHSQVHRMGVGVIVMVVGVSIAKFTETIYIVHFFGDVFGYMIHAIGAIPFIESFENNHHLDDEVESEKVEDK